MLTIDSINGLTLYAERKTYCKPCGRNVCYAHCAGRIERTVERLVTEWQEVKSANDSAGA